MIQRDDDVEGLLGMRIGNQQLFREVLAEGTRVVVTNTVTGERIFFTRSHVAQKAGTSHKWASQWRGMRIG